MCGGLGLDGSSGGQQAAPSMEGMFNNNPQWQQLGQSIHKLMQPVQAYEQQHHPGMVQPQGLAPPAQGGGVPAMAPAPRAPGAYSA